MKKRKENMKQRKTKDPIPENVSREELAKFWDTHSFADYWDDLKPVKVEVAKNLQHEVRIRLDSDSIKKLDEKAQKRGIRFDTLAKNWILEHLQN